jgi:multidrug transporter EmrE-like cation transporter
MFSALIVGLGLAVLASLALNGSYLLQHAGSRAAPSMDLRRPLVTMRGLLRSRVWLVGTAAGALGSVLHIAALAHAPLSLVQAFTAGGLVLTVPVAARAFGQRLERSEQLAVAVLVTALALLGLGAGALVAHAVPVGALAGAVGLAALAAGGLALVPAGGRGRLLGAAGGVLYGAADATTKAVTMTHGGLIAAVTSPWMVVLVLLCVAAFACFQRGLQIGPAVPVIAVMTGATNAVAIVIGLLVFGEPLGAGPAFAAVHLVAFALAVAAGLTLARAQGRLAPADQATRELGRGDGTRSHSAPARSATRSSRRRIIGTANSTPETPAPITAPASTSPG